MNYVESHKHPEKGQQYEDWYATDKWSQFLWSREQEVLGKVLENMFGDRPVKALDFACGTGRISCFLETRVASCTGVDVSDSMLAEARRKVRHTELIRENILERNPFAKESFDLITAFRFFVNAGPDLRQAAMRALAPLLVPGGYLIFNNHQNIGAPYMRLTRAYAGWRGAKLFNVMSIAECRALAQESGLEITEIHGVGALKLPRLKLPRALFMTVDRCLCSVPAVARRSVSPILIARKLP